MVKSDAFSSFLFGLVGAKLETHAPVPEVFACV